jgi:small subunit ribosomal protein S3
MGQKAHPIGNRLGIIKGWDSNWFGGNNYSDKLVEDEKIRKYIAARISKGGISKVVIERTLKRITVTIHTARPGIVIGKGGQEVDRLKEELKKLTKKDVQINIFEIKRPELDAQLVGEGIAKQLEARISFRRGSSCRATRFPGFFGISVSKAGRERDYPKKGRGTSGGFGGKRSLRIGVPAGRSGRTTSEPSGHVVG